MPGACLVLPRPRLSCEHRVKLETSFVTVASGTQPPAVSGARAPEYPEQASSCSRPRLPKLGHVLPFAGGQGVGRQLSPIVDLAAAARCLWDDVVVCARVLSASGLFLLSVLRSFW